MVAGSDETEAETDVGAVGAVGLEDEVATVALVRRDEFVVGVPAEDDCDGVVMGAGGSCELTARSQRRSIEQMS